MAISIGQGWKWGGRGIKEGQKMEYNDPRPSSQGKYRVKQISPNQGKVP